MKKIFFFLVFFLSIFLFVKQTAFAATCANTLPGGTCINKSLSAECYKTASGTSDCDATTQICCQSDPTCSNLGGSCFYGQCSTGYSQASGSTSTTCNPNGNYVCCKNSCTILGGVCQYASISGSCQSGYAEVSGSTGTCSLVGSSYACCKAKPTCPTTTGKCESEQACAIDSIYTGGADSNYYCPTAGNVCCTKPPPNPCQVAGGTCGTELGCEKLAGFIDTTKACSSPYLCCFYGNACQAAGGACGTTLGCEKLAGYIDNTKTCASPYLCCMPVIVPPSGGGTCVNGINVGQYCSIMAQAGSDPTKKCVEGTICKQGSIRDVGTCTGTPTCTITTGTINPSCEQGNVDPADCIDGTYVIPTCKDGICKTAIGPLSTNYVKFVKDIFSVLLALVGGIAVLLIIIAGYKLTTSRGNPEQVKGAQEQLTAAIVGLLFVIFSLVFLEVIGISILGLPITLTP